MLVKPSTIEVAAAALMRGEPVVFPTDTVYGVGVAVGAAKSPQVLYDLKHREDKKPIAWLVGSHDDLARYGRAVPEFASVLARTFWPGPLTLVVNASDEVLPAFRSAEGTIGLRMPANETALALVRAAGVPVATTSANPSGMKAPRTWDAVDESILRGAAACVRDDAQKSGVASTVLDCTADHPVVMRRGAVSIAQIQALC